jgi:hypothetical protein
VFQDEISLFFRKVPHDKKKIDIIVFQRDAPQPTAAHINGNELFPCFHERFLKMQKKAVFSARILRIIKRESETGARFQIKSEFFFCYRLFQAVFRHGYLLAIMILDVILGVFNFGIAASCRLGNKCVHYLKLFRYDYLHGS